jgi:hypothetical protein
MTELVGRVSMKALVRETTDLIERLCIEAALRHSRPPDGRSALALLGLLGAVEVAEAVAAHLGVECARPPT